jgi:hypothetical protein
LAIPSPIDLPVAKSAAVLPAALPVASNRFPWWDGPKYRLPLRHGLVCETCAGEEQKCCERTSGTQGTGLLVLPDYRHLMLPILNRGDLNCYVGKDASFLFALVQSFTDFEAKVDQLTVSGSIQGRLQTSSLCIETQRLLLDRRCK